MLVFWEQRLVFLATPKTGSTAIEAALDGLASIAVLRPPEAKHTTAQRYRRFLGPWLRAATKADFEVVALMREPLDWLGSWYRFRQRDDIPDAEKGTAGMGFDDFVRDYLSDPRPPHADVGSQARFLTVPGTGLAVDRLFAYERIDRFVAFLEDRLDCEIILPKLNVSPLAAMDLSAGTQARHREACTADYALWEGLAHG
jgi:hypothetical protein